MTACLIAGVKVTDDAWLPDYTAKVHAIVAKRGGTYLSRGANIRTIEGQGLDTTVIALIASPRLRPPRHSRTIPNTRRSARPARPGASAGFA